ncbi:MAG: zonular occludens toxin domain-containing protein, partial [Armatimonadota bacterium]|nr:zonular occludens toxin domain-containing protein [Armatimonadota bacterium]
NAADVLAEQLKRKGIRLTQLHEYSTFQQAIQTMQDDKVSKQIYSSIESRNRLLEMLQDPSVTDPLYEEAWNPVARLFRERDDNNCERPTAEQILDRALGSVQPRPVIVVDLSGQGLENFWSEEVQALLLSRLAEGLLRKAEQRFGGKSLNALVVLDEAHRIVPSESLDSESERADLRRRLIDAVRTTRKYGLGWLFISQSLSSIHRSILDQLRIMIFGFGLAQGEEFRRLRDFAGGDDRAMELYQSFRDPTSFPRRDLQQFPFMAVGPVSPLSFSGRPLFFTAFTDPKEFMQANNLKDDTVLLLSD